MAIVRIQKEDFDSAAEMQHLAEKNGDVGAIVSFTGLVRGSDEKGGISSLIIEHYPAMTMKEITRIAETAETRWPLMACVVIHRFGTLQPGDPIVFVGTASAHRKHAFEAAEFLMDWLKTKAPFWKQEKSGEETVWVDAKHDDQDMADRWG